MDTEPRWVESLLAEVCAIPQQSLRKSKMPRKNPKGKRKKRRRKASEKEVYKICVRWTGGRGQGDLDGGV